MPLISALGILISAFKALLAQDRQFQASQDYSETLSENKNQTERKKLVSVYLSKSQMMSLNTIQVSHWAVHLSIRQEQCQACLPNSKLCVMVLSGWRSPLPIVCAFL